MFQRMDSDNPDVWEEISEDDMRYNLAGYYTNVDDVVQVMRDDPDVHIRTSFAYYRWIED